MKPFAIAALVLALPAGAAFAQDLTTMQYVLKNGIVMHADVGGRKIDVPVTYKDDGTTSTGMGAQPVSGKWRIDGDKLCTVNTANPSETCFPIPAGKKPGDTFDANTPAFGPVTITINKEPAVQSPAAGTAK